MQKKFLQVRTPQLMLTGTVYHNLLPLFNRWSFHRIGLCKWVHTIKEIQLREVSLYFSILIGSHLLSYQRAQRNNFSKPSLLCRV